MAKEKFIVAMLTMFDRLMDAVTFGLWTKVRGDVVPNVKVKE